MNLFPGRAKRITDPSLQTPQSVPDIDIHPVSPAQSAQEVACSGLVVDDLILILIQIVFGDIVIVFIISFHINREGGTVIVMESQNVMTGLPGFKGFVNGKPHTGKTHSLLFHQVQELVIHAVTHLNVELI